MKFAANLTFMFKELPFLERFAEAKAAGFEAVEVLLPYDEAASEIARRLAELNLAMVSLNTPPPNWAGGERGFAAVPMGEDRFRKDFKRALRFADFLRSDHMLVMAGKAKGVVATETFKRNLTWAAQHAPSRSLTVEPVNAHDMPGYFLTDLAETARLIREIDRPNVGLQFDLYHIHHMTGDVMKAWDDYGDLVRHIQIACPVDRGEPDKGEFDFAAFFKAIKKRGYKGWVSAEYTPRKRTDEGLGWMADLAPAL
ncbi:hydroxypyruvate isomerase family protein [Celeribacter sp.]|uniref:hydroxypyruvate isomerase family protein n=1 Tax=Celeribacter sp. TaxID=1890673 RepID=UPI003A8E7ABD